MSTAWHEKKGTIFAYKIYLLDQTTAGGRERVASVSSLASESSSCSLREAEASFLLKYYL